MIKKKAQKPKKTTSTKTTKAKSKKPFVWYDTISKNVRQLSYPGETTVVKVGKHRIRVTRSEYLDRYGNPVHTATVLGASGTHRTNYAASAVSGALKKSGVETKYRKTKKKR